MLSVADMNALDNTEQPTVYLLFFTPMSTCIQAHLPGVRLVDIDDRYLADNPEYLDTIRRKAEIILTYPKWIKTIMQIKTEKLKWVHLSSAGVDEFINAAENIKVKSRFQLSRTTSGVYGKPLAEYVICIILANEKKIFAFYKDFHNREWKIHSNGDGRLLSSLTVGVLEVGSIGRIVAEHCKAMGMTVWGMTRTSVTKETMCPAVNVYRTTDKLHEVLQACDYIVNVLPGTRWTTDLLSGGILANCKERKSYLINIGRGDVISEDSLEHAINNGWLSGATLDTLKQEPPSDNSQLWSLPNVFVTPHIAWESSSFKEDLAREFSANYKLFTEGKPLNNECRWDHSY